MEEEKEEKNINEREQDNNIKLKYLSNLYPSHTGPDYDLIKIIEEMLLYYGTTFSIEKIAGLDNIKLYFKEEIIDSLCNIDNIKNKKIKDVLLYGAPGTGKTFLVKVFSNQEKIKILNFHPSNLISQLNKEKDKIIKIIFDITKFYSPSILFIDEIDLLYYKGEDEINNELINQINILNSSNYNNGLKNIIIVGATNKPWKLNDKILNLFEKKIYIPLLKEKERKKLLENEFEKYKLDKNVNLDEIDRMTEGYTGSDIYAMCQSAMYEALKRKIKDDKDFLEKESSKNFDLILSMDDIINAIKNGNKTMSKKDLDEYKNFEKKYESQ